MLLSKMLSKILNILLSINIKSIILKYQNINNLNNLNFNHLKNKIESTRILYVY